MQNILGGLINIRCISILSLIGKLHFVNRLELAMAQSIRNVYDSGGHIKKSLCEFAKIAPTEPINGGIEGKQMYSVVAIADELLRLAKRAAQELTPLQLMKLTYIAHGWHLAIKGSPLFREQVQAWKYGPVIPDLYHATKSFGRNSIPLSSVDDTRPHMTEEVTQTFLADVYKNYGSLTGIQLSNLTHKAGTPWSQVYDERILGIEIPTEVIKNHYLGLLHERTKGSST